nr:MAG TPA: hypothetical protein [Caudoviricetes sp.]
MFNETRTLQKKISKIFALAINLEIFFIIFVIL